MSRRHERLTRRDLLTLFRDISDRVEKGDSLEGSLEWLLPDPDTMPDNDDLPYFDVSAAYRVGNTMGQGGMRFVGDPRNDPIQAHLRTLERENDLLRQKLRYLRACAHLFPHVNTDRATNELVGLPDEGDVWCLACTVGSTVEEFDAELLAGDDEAEYDARARAWRDEYERADAARYTAEEEL